MNNEERRAYMLEIVAETKEYYADGTKYGYDSEKEVCLYRAPNGNQCAFARRCHQIPARIEGLAASEVLKDLGDVILIDERDKEVHQIFWDNLQNVHDMAAMGGNWSDEEIIELIESGYFDLES